MTTPTKTPRRLGYFTVEAEVDLEDIADDLEEAGWHHEDDCKQGRSLSDELAQAEDAIRQLTEAVRSLHRQAHPTQDPACCPDEPCRSLPLRILLPAFKETTTP